MSKLGNPLGGVLWLTQGYHGDQYGNRAIDFSAVAEAPVYAMADGRVVNRAATGGSWIAIDYADSNIRSWYVHTYKWTKSAGQTVAKGELIARIAPASHNGGYPTHLHKGLSWNNGQAGFPNLIDYMDRRISFNTNYVSIANAWFSGLNFRWELHQDLSYTVGPKLQIGSKVEFSADTNLRGGEGTGAGIVGTVAKGAVGTIIDGPRSADGYTWYDIKFLNSTGWVANVGNDRLVLTDKATTNVDGSIPQVQPPVEPPPTPPTCEAERAQIEALQVQIQGLKNDIAVREKAIVEKNDTINAQRAQLAMKDSEYNKLVKEIEGIRDEIFLIRKNYDEQIKDLKELIEKKDKQIEELKDKVGMELENITFKDMIIRIGMWFGLGTRRTE